MGKQMTLKDFTKLIESYGANPQDWPGNVRENGIELINTDSSAKEFLSQHQELESLLDEIEIPDFPGLAHAVLNQPLPARQLGFADQLISWFIPENFGLQLWRPVTAACLPLVFGVVLGNYYSFGVTDQDIELEYWDDELALLSFNDFADEYSDLDF